MIEQFIPYHEALELEKLGFNQPCILALSWTNDTDRYTKQRYKPRAYLMGSTEIEYDFSKFKIEFANNYSTEIRVPTFSQAFKFFREKCNLIPNLQYYGNWNFEIFRVTELAEPIDDLDINYTFKGGTYEEAELECLVKLIDIVKNKL